MITELNTVIRQSLSEFVGDIFESGWFGREREAISLYTFGYLLRYCNKNNFLKDAKQIGIEVAVPQLSVPNAKTDVCKDLVIWPKPAMTCWNNLRQHVNYPSAILEWKTNTTVISKRDVEWLSAFSQLAPNFVGYAVSLDLKHRNFRLSCARIYQRKIIYDWLLLK